MVLNSRCLKTMGSLSQQLAIQSLMLDSREKAGEGAEELLEGRYVEGWLGGGVIGSFGSMF